MKRILFIIAASTLLLSCNKSKTTGLKINLVDAPGDFEQVNIQIIGMEAKINEASGDGEAWHTLDINQGTYDLLQLQTTAFLLVDDEEVPEGELKELRLILGTANTVKVDGVLHDLSTPSAESAGLKVKVDKSLHAETNELTIDFDAHESVKQNGNGSYKLEPLIRLK